MLSANLKRLGTLLRDKERNSLAHRQRLRAAYRISTLIDD